MVTSSWPAETTTVNPRWRRVRRTAEKTEPEWVMKATGPAGRGDRSTYPMARTPSATLTKPMHPPPQTAIPAAHGHAGHPIPQCRATAGPDQAPVDDRRAVAPPGGQDHLLLHGPVRHTQQHHIHRAVDLLQRAQARSTEHRGRDAG